MASEHLEKPGNKFQDQGATSQSPNIPDLPLWGRKVDNSRKRKTENRCIRNVVLETDAPNTMDGQAHKCIYSLPARHQDPIVHDDVPTTHPIIFRPHNEKGGSLEKLVIVGNTEGKKARGLHAGLTKWIRLPPLLNFTRWWGLLWTGIDGSKLSV